MLQRLYIQNFALIDRMEIAFSNGINILTGETGAGKSILIGAMGLILGRRADSSVLISDEKCVIEAEFQLPDVSQFLALVTEEDLDLEGNHLILRREITKSGKSRAFVNDSPVNLQTLKAITEPLIDIHGQYDNQYLMNEGIQLDILDQYAGIRSLVVDFGQQWQRWKSIQTEIHNLVAQESEAKRQTDYYLFQVKELQEARLNVEEEKQIEEELKLLENAGLIGETLSKAIELMDESEDSVSYRLSFILKSLEKINHLSPQLSDESNKISEALTLLHDASLELQSIRENLEADPRRLEFLHERMNVINNLKLKYSVKSVAELIRIQEDFEAKINLYASINDMIEDLERQAQVIAQTLMEKGLEIEKHRTEATQTLAEKVNLVLKEVGLAKTDFQIAINRLTDEKGALRIDNQSIQPDMKGINSVRYMVRTNEGMPYGSLAQVASGGEISRVMLSLKSALAEQMQLSVLVFDEIDTGISGEVARKVGRVMEKLGEKHQILTITHLPQIASRGKHHYFIYKDTKDGRAVSQIRKLNAEERVLEIAKMLSGENPTTHALESARELIATY